MREGEHKNNEKKTKKKKEVSAKVNLKKKEFQIATGFSLNET